MIRFLRNKSIKELILIGYWHSDDHPDYPDPAWFVDPSWNPVERTLVSNYLRSGVEFSRECGYSWCRFRCGLKGVHLGDGELTDGVYYWPEGFVHYIEEHHVKLPGEFLEHVLKNPVIDRKKLEKNLGKSGPDNLNIRCRQEWWKGQKGHARGKSFRSRGFAGLTGKLWLIETPELTYPQIRFLRALNFLTGYPLSRIKSELSHKERILLDDTCEYCHGGDLIKKARGQGLRFKIEMPS